MKRKRNADLIDVSLSFAVSSLALVNTKYLGESPNLVLCITERVCHTLNPNKGSTGGRDLNMNGFCMLPGALACHHKGILLECGGRLRVMRSTTAHLRKIVTFRTQKRLLIESEIISSKCKWLLINSGVLITKKLLNSYQSAPQKAAEPLSILLLHLQFGSVGGPFAGFFPFFLPDSG